MILLLALLTGPALQPAAAAEPQALPARAADPAAIFRRVCLERGMALERSAAEPVALDELPYGLRSAIDAYTVERGLPEPFRRYSRLGPRDIPNLFFRLRPHPAYLMAPRQDADPKSTGRQCAVFWRGNHWPELREALRPWIVIPDPAVPRSAFMGRIAIQNEFDGHLVTVANYGGWSMMRTIPVHDPKPAGQADR